MGTVYCLQPSNGASLPGHSPRTCTAGSQWTGRRAPRTAGPGGGGSSLAGRSSSGTAGGACEKEQPRQRWTLTDAGRRGSCSVKGVQAQGRKAGGEEGETRGHRGGGGQQRRRTHAPSCSSGPSTTFPAPPLLHAHAPHDQALAQHSVCSWLAPVQVRDGRLQRRVGGPVYVCVCGGVHSTAGASSPTGPLLLTTPGEGCRARTSGYHCCSQLKSCAPWLALGCALGGRRVGAGPPRPVASLAAARVSSVRVRGEGGANEPDADELWPLRA